MNAKHLFYVFNLLVVLTACNNLSEKKSITVAGLVFYNDTTSPVHNVKLSVSKTYEMVACGIILPGKECSTTFPQREYQGNPVMVSWEQAGQLWSIRTLEVQLPGDFITNQPTNAVITLGKRGSASARLIPQPSASTPPAELQPQLK
ncbi:MAG: hypothetical protein R3354_06240 [Thiohalomonadales bacterium]|nr:hypothetical protein [Thiohalomonadales bacterium]